MPYHKHQQPDIKTNFKLQLSEGRRIHIFHTAAVCFFFKALNLWCMVNVNPWATQRIEPLCTRVDLMSENARKILQLQSLWERKRKREVCMYIYNVLIHTIFMQCKSYSKSITASNWKKPLCFPRCMLLHKLIYFIFCWP